MTAPRPKSASRDVAIALLSPTLGEEKARSTVDAAAHALGLAGREWSSEQLRALFAHISMEAGLVGITARVVSRRLRPPPEGQAASAPAPAPSSELRAGATAAKPVEAVADLLTQALGAQTAARQVENAAHALGYGATIDFDQALKLLDRLAREPGLVGIAARFAKTRLHFLTW